LSCFSLACLDVAFPGEGGFLCGFHEIARSTKLKFFQEIFKKALTVRF